MLELDEKLMAEQQDLSLDHSSVKQEMRKRLSSQTCRTGSILTLCTLILMLLIGVVVMVIFKTEVDRLRQQLDSLKQQTKDEVDPESEFTLTQTTTCKTFNLYGSHIELSA